MQAAHRRATYAEYMAIEAASSQVKHEFVSGAVVAMSGAPSSAAA